ncbi:uncharacterized protein DS421_12g357820 [Arachis hypogaea]|nr:uncharacterized protein DS421_12g357820 [Arachis hypogaea]
MGGASHAMKRIPRIKFPQRHPKSSGSASAAQGLNQTGDAGLAFFSGSNASAPAAGKASLQPKRTPVSKEEIEAILNSPDALIGGIAYGGYARKIVGRALRSMQSEYGGAARIEDHPQHLLMALKEALALVGPVKCL